VEPAWDSVEAPKPGINININIIIIIIVMGSDRKTAWRLSFSDENAH